MALDGAPSLHQQACCQHPTLLRGYLHGHVLYATRPSPWSHHVCHKATSMDTSCMPQGYLHGHGLYATRLSPWTRPVCHKAISYPVMPGSCWSTVREASTLKAPPWPHHGLTMTSSWPHHGLTMASSWPHHGLTMASPWPHHGLIMASPWPLA